MTITTPESKSKWTAVGYMAALVEGLKARGYQVVRAWRVITEEMEDGVWQYRIEYHK